MTEVIQDVPFEQQQQQKIKGSYEPTCEYETSEPFPFLGI